MCSTSQPKSQNCSNLLSNMKNHSKINNILQKDAVQVSDQCIGAVLLGGTLAAFIYYTLWVIILPFVDKEQEFVYRWFPDTKYSLGLPLLAGVFGLILIGGFVSRALMTSKKTEKTS